MAKKHTTLHTEVSGYLRISNNRTWQDFRLSVLGFLPKNEISKKWIISMLSEGIGGSSNPVVDVKNIHIAYIFD